MAERWSTVASFAYRPQADVVVSVLEGHGIPARVRGDDAGGAAPHVGWGTGGITVEVPRDRAVEARRFLAEAEPDADPTRDTTDGAPVDGTLPGGVGRDAAAAGSGVTAALLGLTSFLRRRRGRRLEDLDD